MQSKEVVAAAWKVELFLLFPGESTETTTAIRQRDYNTKMQERLVEGCVRVWFSDPSVWVLCFFWLSDTQGRSS